MRNFLIRLSAAAFSLSVLAVAGTALATTPSLYVSSSGSSMTLTINNASPNTPVYLYQRQGSSNYTISTGSIGTTDQNGSASLTQTLTFDGSSNPVNIYVMVNGVSFPDPSTPLSIPPGSCSSGCVSGTLTLSQTSVSLNSPGSTTVIASPSSGSVSVTNNSNSSVANAFTSGDSIIITGQTTGSTTLTVCSTVSTTQCNSILVTVNGGSSTTLNFSNSNPVVIAGQSSTVTIYSPSNSNSSSYYVSSNSNSNVVTNPSISGATLYFTGGSPGSATLSICQSGSSYCGSLPINVGNNGLGGMSISPSTLTLTTGNTGTATINNTTGALSITNNSNNSVVSASVSNASGQTSQTVTVYAIAAGSSTLTICPTGSSSGCVYLYIQVGASNTNNNTNSGISFSLPNPVMTVGQSQSIAIYSNNGGTSYSISNNTTANIVSLSLSGGSLYLVGQNIGSSTVTICQTASTICGTLYVTVNGTSGGLTFTPSNANVSLNQSQTIAITGGNGSFYISSNTNPSTAAVSLQGNSLYITGLNSGNTTVTICQSNNTSVCGTAAITVGGSTNSTGTLSLSNPSPIINIGQTQNITISGGSSSSYYISSISNPSIAGVNITGSNLSLTGISAGTTNLSICQTGNSTCASLTAIVSSTGLSATSSTVSFITTTFPSGVIGQAYTSQIQAQGGAGNYTYTLTSGSLPTGLTMSAAGLIAGTPTVAGTSNITVTAADSSNVSAVNAFSIVINATASTPATTSSAYPNGELISENKTIYIVYQNTKVGFASAAAFTGLGYKFSNVVPVTNSGLTVSTKVVTSPIGHPRGAWILSGSTVYFVTPAGLIGVPDWATFLANGGQASFIVKATTYDLTLPKLSKMLANDSRLQP